MTGAGVLDAVSVALCTRAADAEASARPGAERQFAAGNRPRTDQQGFDGRDSEPFRAGGPPAMLSRPVAGGAPADAAELDPAALARLAELDPSGANKLIERVLAAFRTSVARLRPQLAAARERGDRATVRLVAHTLRSSAASIGALALSGLCAQVEASLRDDPAAALPEPALDAFELALDAALLAIARRLGT